MSEDARGETRRATLSGALAILLWALLALFSAGAGDIPPFQLSAICFATGGLGGLAFLVWKGAPVMDALRQPPPVWMLGVGGIFGYHFCYFTAVQNAPVAEASLIAYLWPLLIVLFSGLLPGERLRWPHLLGAAMGFAGAALLVARGGLAFDSAYSFGYGVALLCALIWSSYSVGSRLVKSAPTASVAGFCLVAAVLALACHLAFEPATHWPRTALQWASVAALGLGPVGAAFFFWDHGMKRGDIQLLGVGSYAAPLLSTIALALAGLAEPGWRLALACLLIAGGGALAGLAGRKRVRVIRNGST